MRLLALITCCGQYVHCLDNGLALAPPMGWNSWNAFHDDINEAVVHTAADILVSSGLQGRQGWGT